MKWSGLSCPDRKTAKRSSVTRRSGVERYYLTAVIVVKHDFVSGNQIFGNIFPSFAEVFFPNLSGKFLYLIKVHPQERFCLNSYHWNSPQDKSTALTTAAASFVLSEETTLQIMISHVRRSPTRNMKKESARQIFLLLLKCWLPWARNQQSFIKAAEYWKNPLKPFKSATLWIGQMVQHRKRL